MTYVAVKRVRTGTGSHIEPPLEDDWPELRKLQWHAAVATVDCGIPIEVEESDYSTKRFGVWIRNRGYYDLRIPGSSSGPHSFGSAWSTINGISDGANAARRQAVNSGTE